MASTDMCMFYLRGACRFGNRCWNSHQWSDWTSFGNELIPPPTNLEIESEDEDPSTSSTIDASQQNKPSTSSTFCEYLRYTAEPEEQQSDSDEPEEIDDQSSNDESIKSTENNDEETVEKKEKIGLFEVVKEELESSLQCHVCMEIFIKPTVLNCSHTFCLTCILLWMRKTNRCPMCRISIRSKSYCLALETYIEKVIQFMPEEVRLERIEAIQGRSEINVFDYLPDDSAGDTLTRIMTSQNDHPLYEFYVSSSSEHQDERPSVNTSDDDIEESLIRDQTEVMRMNLHDLILNSGGINPLSRYPTGTERWSPYVLQ